MILDKSRLSTGATRHRGISEKCAFSPRKTMFFTTQPWRSLIQFKQIRTKKRSSLSHHNQDAFVTPLRHHFGSIWAPFWSKSPSKMHAKTIKKRAGLTKRKKRPQRGEQDENRGSHHTKCRRRDTARTPQGHRRDAISRSWVSLVESN